MWTVPGSASSTAGSGPLGASDGIAAQAEALQTSLGEGPCLDATATSDPLLADESCMAVQWPVFHHELVAETPIRAVALMPLTSARLRQFGVLDLYATSAEMLQRLSLNEVSTNIADLIAAMLFEISRTVSQYGGGWPIWMNSHSATQRMNVWIAVGILLEHADLNNEDALAALLPTPTAMAPASTTSRTRSPPTTSS